MLSRSLEPLETGELSGAGALRSGMTGSGTIGATGSSTEGIGGTIGSGAGVVMIGSSAAIPSFVTPASTFASS